MSLADGFIACNSAAPIKPSSLAQDEVIVRRSSVPEEFLLGDEAASACFRTCPS